MIGVSMNRATTKQPMLWMPTSAPRTWILPMCISRPGCNCSATMVSRRGCRTSTAHLLHVTCTLNCIKRREWARLLVHNGARPARRPFLPEPDRLRPAPLPRTGVVTIWRRSSILSPSPSRQTRTIALANRSGHHRPQGRSARGRSR